MSAPLPVKVERPPVSLSMGAACRMKLWLAGHGREKESVPARTQRIFDMGIDIEARLFDSTEKLDDATGEVEIRPAWWNTFEEVTEPVTGETLIPSEWEVGGRQDEVEIDGFKGHIDAIIRHKKTDEFRIVDAKSARQFPFTKNRTAKLEDDVFARLYVMQLQMYMEGKRLQGDSLGIRKAMLFFINKDDASGMFRSVEYDPVMVAEGRERLSWARSTAEPMPDWKWEKGTPIPTPCGYCDRKAACAEVRGVALTFAVERNKPVWRQA